MLVNSLRHIAFKTSNRIHHNQRVKNYRKQKEKVNPKLIKNGFERIKNESIRYDDKEAINLMIDYFNKYSQKGLIRKITSRGNQILLADYKHSRLWLVESQNNFIKTIWRY